MGLSSHWRRRRRAVDGEQLLALGASAVAEAGREARAEAGRAKEDGVGRAAVVMYAYSTNSPRPMAATTGCMPGMVLRRLYVVSASTARGCFPSPPRF